MLRVIRVDRIRNFLLFHCKLLFMPSILNAYMSASGRVFLSNQFMSLIFLFLHNNKTSQCLSTAVYLPAPKFLCELLGTSSLFSLYHTYIYLLRIFYSCTLICSFRQFKLKCNLNYKIHFGKFIFFVTSLVEKGGAKKFPVENLLRHSTYVTNSRTK